MFITLHEGSVTAPVLQATGINAIHDDLGVGIVKIDSLTPDTIYYYRLWEDEAGSIALDTNGLAPDDLHFRTLPEHGYDRQLDFLLMSDHYPETAKGDGFEGFAVWRQIPRIMSENNNVRFAILAGNQIFADEIETQVLKETDSTKRKELYLTVYRKFWNNIHYRRVLCSVPAVLMWDDHDIADGWGVREDSFFDDQSSNFRKEWQDLFKAARTSFHQMQASRNPEADPTHNTAGFDFCFRVGRAGFVVPDLRSNRNSRVPRIMLPEQMDSIRKWVDVNKKGLDVLFFVSTTSFSQGTPMVEGYMLRVWFLVLDTMNVLRRFLRRFYLLRKAVRSFNHALGDLRDDMDDSWASDVNRSEADRVLDFLFDLQNPANPKEAINIVILSGGIRAPGHSTIYSAGLQHKRKALIPHIEATPIAYEPFSWIGESIFRHFTRLVELGDKGQYFARLNQPFDYRNVIVVSLRQFPGARIDQPELHLKVKYYLEDDPEPQIVLCDLNRTSHRESIEWQELPQVGEAYLTALENSALNPNLDIETGEQATNE